jgi:hypothetical protein
VQGPFGLNPFVVDGKKGGGHGFCRFSIDGEFSLQRQGSNVDGDILGVAESTKKYGQQHVVSAQKRVKGTQ